MLTFQANPRHMGEALGEQEVKRPSGGDSRKASVETLVETSVKTSVKILRLLEEDPSMTLAQIATRIERSLRGVELASSKLIKEGRLRYVGPKKGGHWEVLK